jgi:hypothetical protein
VTGERGADGTWHETGLYTHLALMAAEVKTYQAASNCRFTTLPSVNNPNNIPSPYANPFAVAPEYDNGVCMTETRPRMGPGTASRHVPGSCS